MLCVAPVTDESLISLATGVCSASLESLVCKGITAQISDRGILALVSGCPILHTLHLGAPGITNLSLLALSLYCPNLKMLSFSSPLISDQGSVTHNGTGACRGQRACNLVVWSCMHVMSLSHVSVQTQIPMHVHTSFAPNRHRSSHPYSSTCHD